MVSLRNSASGLACRLWLALCLVPLDAWATREFIGVTLRRSGR